MADTVKHTPGPWIVDGPLHNQIVWCGPDERVCFLAHSNGEKPSQDKANGLLIAAAPDLLRELKALLAHYVELAKISDDGFWDPEKEQRATEAQAAIARAEGRS